MGIDIPEKQPDHHHSTTRNNQSISSSNFHRALPILFIRFIFMVSNRIVPYKIELLLIYSHFFKLLFLTQE
jgi:hypothetical protein